MPKKNKGGNKHRRSKNNFSQENNNLLLKEEGQEYALVTNMKGGGRCDVLLPDNSEKIGIIRGKLRKKRSWIGVGDLVLIGVRDYEEGKCDIIHKYSPSQIQGLKKNKELPLVYTNFHKNGMQINNTNNQVEIFEFGDVDEEDGENSDEIINDNESEIVDSKKNVIIDEKNIINDNKDEAFDIDWDAI